MGDLPEEIDGLPNICGSEQRIDEAIRARGTDPVFLPPGATGFGDVDSAFAIALHMHQPLIPAGGPDLRTAPIIGNLQGCWTTRASATTTMPRCSSTATGGWASSSLGCSTRGWRPGSCSNTPARCCTG